jgi:hypothetical protein
MYKFIKLPVYWDRSALKNLLRLMPKAIVLTLLFTVLLKNSAFADERGELGQWKNTLDEVEKEQPVKKIGKAVFSVFIWDVYESKLSTSSGQYPEISKNGTLIYKINYLRSITSKELIQRTIEQWQHLGIKEDVYNAFIPQLKEIWPNVTSGDSLALVIEQNSSAFYFNNQFAGSIEDADFTPLFLDIWLSKNTSEPKLRTALLGN